MRRWWVVAVALIGGALAVVRRIEIEGESMLPTLVPGDRVLMVRIVRPRVGQLVVLHDPRDGKLLVKRVVALRGGEVFVRGDNISSSTDSRTFGGVPRRRVCGRVVWRYAPSERAGRVSPWVDWCRGSEGADNA